VSLQINKRGTNDDAAESPRIEEQDKNGPVEAG